MFENQRMDIQVLAKKYTARPQKFYHKFKVLKNGDKVAEEWVDWIKLGDNSRSVTPERIDRCMKQPYWPIFEPAYKAFKEGLEAPVQGTPLGAWPALLPEHVDVFRRAGLKTVEDIANVTDSVLDRIPMPGVRAFVTQAKAYIAAQDTMVAAAEIEKVVAENADLKERLSEMEAMLKELMVERDQPDKPRRGRPPKQHEDAEQESVE